MTDFEQALEWFNSRPVKAWVRSFSDYEVKFTGTVAEAEAFVVTQGESLEVLKRFTYRDGLHPLPGDVQGDLYIAVDQPPMKCTCKCGGCGGVADASASCRCWACRCNDCVTRWDGSCCGSALCWACRCNDCVTLDQMREEDAAWSRSARR